MAVSDLTGCTWVGNSTIQYDSSFPTLSNAYNVNYKAYYNGGADYDSGTSLYMDSYEDEAPPPFPSILMYGLLGAGLQHFWGAFFGQCIYEGNTTTTMSPTAGDETLDYIEFTGGTDATNSTLISWLESNGTLTAPQPQPSSKISVGSNLMTQAFVGSTEVSKMILNGVTLYEKAASGNAVTITFQNGVNTSNWVSTEIYDDYFESAGKNKIGEILSADGTVTVITTNKLCIVTTISRHTESLGTITLSDTITFVSWGSGTADYQTARNYDVSGNGNITFDGIDWDF